MNIFLTLPPPTKGFQQRWRTRFLGFAAMCFSTAISAQLNVSISSTNPSCSGYTNGEATATVSGGTAPYTYQWVNGNGGATVSGLAAGTYGVTVTDASNHTVTGVATLANPAILSANVTFADICAVGNVTGVVTGGTAPYTYAWSNGATTATIQPPVGSLTLTATDVKGCISTKWVNIPNFLAVSLEVTGLRCFGDCDAAITPQLQGGTAPITFLWNTGATTPTLEGVPAGNYGVTVTDANGCVKAAEVTILNPTVINVAVTSTNATCGNNNGTATVTASGGVAPLTYKWSNGATTASVTGLSIGNHTVTVTDGNLCPKTATVEITSSNGFTVNATATNANCGTANGSVNAVPNGGTAPFQYAWSNGATTQQVSNIGAGEYRVTVTDANGCAGMATASVTASGSLTIRMDKTDAACGIMNGTATARVTGGTTPYTYLWDNGKTTQTIDMLHPKAYRVTVTDASGCSVARTIIINQTLFFLAEVEGRDTRCFQTNDGEATAMGTGGTPPYTYAWSNGATTQKLTNLNPGLYTVTLSDPNGCTATESIEIHQPDAIYILLNGAATTCGNANGSVQTTVTGGTNPYTYAWSNGSTQQNLSNVVGAEYVVTVTDDNGCYADSRFAVGASTEMTLDFDALDVSCHGSDDGQAAMQVVSGGTAPFTYLWSNGKTTFDIVDLKAGTYTVTVTDAAGCTESADITIYEPQAPLTATVQATNATCGLNNGSVTVTAAGGVTPYVYAWSNGSSDATIRGLGAGAYSVTVQDDHHCRTVATGNVNRVGTALSVTLAGTALNCFQSGDGAVTATVGGTAPYTFAWSNGATTQNINRIQAGTYTLTATDANGCTGTSTTTITEPAALYVVVTPKETTCGLENGSIRTTVEGGTAAYTYLWSNAETDANIGPLAAGVYRLTVTDANGCTANTFTTVDTSTAPSIAWAQTNVTCFGLSNGSATATVTKGIAPYTYEWSNNETTNVITNLVSGTYKLTVTDDNLCTAEDSVKITQPARLTTTITPTHATCSLANGIATSTTAGGTAPYVYTWSNGANTANLTSLSGGNFKLTVQDANQCTAKDSVTITNTPPITVVSVSTTAVKCFGESNGTATAVATGGTGTITYTWSHSATETGASITGLAAGTYTVTATDSVGCTRSKTLVVTQPTLLTAAAVEVQKATCAPVGRATATAAGGTAPYRYAWSNNTTNATIQGVAGGTYAVTVWDANNCRATTSVVIGANTSPNLACTVAQTQAISDGGGTDGKAKVTVTGSNGTLTYRWSNGQTTATATNLGGLTYRVTVTDGYACTTVCSITMQNPPCDNVTNPGRIGTATETYCPGGVIDPITNLAAATGGTGALEYVWMYSRFNIPFSPNTWEMVPGQNGTDLSGAAIQGLNLTDKTYFIRCVRRNGCSFQESNIVTKTPKILGEALIPASICVGSSVTFEAPDNGTGGGIYSWNFGVNATPTTSSSRVQNVTFTTGGRRNVQLTINKNACLSVRSYAVNPVSCTGGIEVGSLKVTAVNHHQIAVTWVTRNESETSVYTVERSSDGGKNFETVHEMPSQRAATVNNYRWNDIAPKMGRSDYRIRRIAFSGKMNYSNTANILMTDGDAKLLAYPNPTGDILFLENLEKLSEGNLEVYNDMGILIHTQAFTPTDTRYSIDLTPFSKGLYLVKTILKSGETNVVRITKF